MTIKGGGRRLSSEEWFKPSVYYDIERLKRGWRGFGALNYWGTSSHHADTNAFADGLIERTSSMLHEVASETKHKGKEGDW